MDDPRDAATGQGATALVLGRSQTVNGPEPAAVGAQVLAEDLAKAELRARDHLVEFAYAIVMSNLIAYPYADRERRSGSGEKNVMWFAERFGGSQRGGGGRLQSSGDLFLD